MGLANNVAAISDAPAEQLYWNQSGMVHDLVCVEGLYSPQQAMTWQSIGNMTFFLSEILERLHTLVQICRLQNPHHKFSLQLGESQSVTSLQQLHCGESRLQTNPLTQGATCTSILIITTSSNSDDCLVTYKPRQTWPPLASVSDIVGCEVSYYWLKPGQTFLLDQKLLWQVLVRGYKVMLLPFTLVVTDLARS